MQHDAAWDKHRSMHGCTVHDLLLLSLLQIAAQAGLGLPEWYDAGKVSIENSKISFGECLPCCFAARVLTRLTYTIAAGAAMDHVYQLCAWLMQLLCMVGVVHYSGPAVMCALHACAAVAAMAPAQAHWTVADPLLLCPCWQAPC